MYSVPFGVPRFTKRSLGRVRITADNFSGRQPRTLKCCRSFKANYFPSPCQFSDCILSHHSFPSSLFAYPYSRHSLSKYYYQSFLLEVFVEFLGLPSTLRLKTSRSFTPPRRMITWSAFGCTFDSQPSSSSRIYQAFFLIFFAFIVKSSDSVNS